MTKPLWMWVFFLSIVILLLILDLGYFRKSNKEIDIKESLMMSGFYIFISFLFSIVIWHQMGFESFSEYLTGFLIEKSLALDNIFLISVVFSSLSIPSKYQHRVLFWGILGVICLRAIMIGIGSQLIAQFSWVLYIFATFMIATGIKMFFIPEQDPDIKNNILLKYIKRHFKITDNIHGDKFLVKKGNQTYMTPLFVALLLIEFIDLIFAIDSVPAIFMITQDSYIVYTSNIFAILGLRALYFALESIIKKFAYLKYALALVLIFIGSKLFIAKILGINKFPASISLGVTFGLIFGGCIYSIYRSNNLLK